MDPGATSRPRVPEPRGPNLRTAGVVRGRRRRRPAGEPPPLPRRIGMTGHWWIWVGSLAPIGWAIAVTNAGGALLPVDQWVREGLARLRTPALTTVMVGVAELSSDWVIMVLGWATILVLLVARRFRHLFVFLGSFFLVQALATYLAGGILEDASPLRPAGIEPLGPAGQSAYPLVPVATLSARLVGILYALIPKAGRDRRARPWPPGSSRWSPWPACTWPSTPRPGSWSPASSASRFRWSPSGCCAQTRSSR